MNPRYIITGALLVVVLAGGIYALRKNQAPLSAGPRENSSAHSKGPKTAPVTIEEFSDFQCPACQKAEPTLKKIMADYPDGIYFTFRHFPLAGHQWSGIAHQAAECAAGQGKFWEFHDKLYDEQPLWSGSANPVEFFLRYGRDLGLDLDPFAACLNDQKIKRRVLLDKTEGEAMKVQSTPTFFINGERVVGPVELENKGRAKVESLLGKPPVLMSIPPEKTT
ncbi:MAG: DsbA family protein [Candidatus Omnitrophica bacterium]|nr:DsbA family protein [Candidatus Omnitrophota bacterium]